MYHMLLPTIFMALARTSNKTHFSIFLDISQTMSVRHIVQKESVFVFFPREGVYSANFAKELEGKYHTRIEKSDPKGHKLLTNPQYQE